jgi:hypothetical protein
LELTLAGLDPAAVKELAPHQKHHLEHVGKEVDPAEKVQPEPFDYLHGANDDAGDCQEPGFHVHFFELQSEHIEVYWEVSDPCITIVKK